MTKNDSKIDSLSFKASYEDNLFKFGFAENDIEKNELIIKAEFDLTKDQFKQYFISLVSLIVKYNEDTKSNFLEEIFKDFD